MTSLTGRTAGASLLLLLIAGQAAAADVRVASTSSYLGKDRYDWKVYLVADPPVLDRIDHVEYILHPSFPDPVRTVTDRAHAFALVSNGWGEFNILVKVFYRNGKTETLQHWLSLRSATPARTAKPPRPPRVGAPASVAARGTAPTPERGPGYGAVKVRNTSAPTPGGQWDFEIFVEADDPTLARIRCVKYTLHPTFPDPVRTVCKRGDKPGRGFALAAHGWGTFVVGVEVTFDNGETRTLAHELKFGKPGA
jgi:transcription initiation factor IIF auxiliary subunit